MKNFKKALSLILALASISSFVPSALATDGNEDVYEVAGETVLYYKDFETGTNEDLPEVEHEKYYFYGRNAKLKEALNVTREYSHAQTNDCASIKSNYNMALDGLIKSEFNGDVGVRVPSNCSIAAGPVVMLDFRYKDADKTPTEEGTLSSGTYKFEFDFVLDGKVSKTDGFRVEANCMHGNCGKSFAWAMNNTWHNLSGGNTWSYTEKDIPITNDELHHYEIIFDLDNNLVHTYMDGVKYKNTKFTSNINFLHVTIGGKLKFIDDIKFSELDVAFEQTAPEANITESGIDYVLGDYVASVDGVTAEITDVYSGEKISAAVKASGSKKISIVPAAALVPGREYVLDVNDAEVATLRGGVTLSDEAFNLGEANCIKKLTLNDFYGGKDSFAKETIAELESFTFEFTEDVTAEDALKNLTLADSDGTAVEFDVVKKDNNVADVVFNPSLKGDKTYNMALTGMSTEYNWSFDTKAGKVALKPVKVYSEDGTTEINVKDAQVGDKIKVKLSLVSTKELTEDYSAMVTAGLYSENSLDGFDFEQVTLTSENDSFEKTVEFEIKDATDLKVKGFLWKGLGTRTPLGPSVSAK